MVTIIFDICHSGTTNKSKQFITPEIISKTLFETNNKIPLLLFSSKARQSAIENKLDSNGVFMKSFKKAISGEADVYPEDKKLLFMNYIIIYKEKFICPLKNCKNLISHI